MSDLIRRGDVEEALQGLHVGDVRFFEKLRKALDDIPSAEPERKKGKWTEYQKSFGVYGQIYYQHDCCPNLYESPYHFCPNCGADMRGE